MVPLTIQLSVPTLPPHVIQRVKAAKQALIQLLVKLSKTKFTTKARRFQRDGTIVVSINPVKALLFTVVALVILLTYSTVKTVSNLSVPSTITEQASLPSLQTFDRVAEKWDRARRQSEGGAAWYNHPVVVSTYKARLAAGSPNEVEHLKLNYGVFDRCLSIGCGDGPLEIQMVQAGLCKHMKGVDLSPRRIGRAQQSVPEELLGQVTFVVENAETSLVHSSKEQYDLILFSHALKHIFDLKAFTAKLQKNVLSRNGIVVLVEYVGAARFQFPPEQTRLIGQTLAELELHYPDRVPDFRKNPLWDGMAFRTPNPDSIQQDDPSETVHSNNIVSILHSHFRLQEDVPLGGNLYQFIFDGAYDQLQDSTGQQIVRDMLAKEMELIRTGNIKSDFVFQIWKHKPKRRRR